MSAPLRCGAFAHFYAAGSRQRGVGDMRPLIFLLLLTGSGVRADDLSFTAALQLAEQSTPLLAVESAKVDAARAAAIPAAALPDPKLLFGVDNVPISGPGRGNLNDDFMTMEKIGVMQEFTNGDKRRARADIANASVARAQAEKLIVRQKIRADVAQAWLQVFYIEQQRQLFDALDRENTLLAQAVNAQLAAGRGSGADALLPREEALAIADRRDELAQKINSARAQLAQWIGNDAYLPLAGGAPEFPIEAGALNKNLHRHPELAAYVPMTQQAEAELREAQAQKKSDWGVELSYQRRGPLYADMVSLQFTYDLPIFAGSRQNPLIESKKHALEQLDGERNAMLREHAAQLAAETAQYHAISAQLQRLNDARLPLAKQKIELTLAGYRAAQGDLSAVVAARRDLLELQLRQNELQREQRQLAAKLFYTYEEVAP
jgi:outer membrane protein TolC